MILHFKIVSATSPHGVMLYIPIKNSKDILMVRDKLSLVIFILKPNLFNLIKIGLVIVFDKFRIKIGYFIVS